MLIHKGGNDMILLLQIPNAMLPNLATVFLLFLVGPVVGKIKFSLKRSFNLATEVNLADTDRARAQSLKLPRDVRSVVDKRQQPPSIPATNQATAYTAVIGIGTPPTDYTLLVDISSDATSLTATYHRTSSSRQFTCLLGSVAGAKFTDTITLSSQLVVTNQVIVTGSSVFTGFDGTLGLGRDMAGDICSTAVPTILDNLFTQGKIESNSVGILFNPMTSTTPLTNGELSFGGFDSSKIVGLMHFTPITSTSPAKLFWGIDGSIQYGATIILSTTAGIIDTGTTLVLIPSNSFQQYLQLTGGVIDQTTGLVKLTSAQAASLESLFFTIGSVTYEFTANAQLWPRILNTVIGGVPNATYSVLNDIGTESGSGLDFILGYTFLERYYSFLDTANLRVGLAETLSTSATTN